MFYIKMASLDARTALLEHFKSNDILAVFHYVPLHTSIAGGKFSRFHGEDNYTTTESERLIRLPLFYRLSIEEQARVISAVREFFE